MPWPHAHAFSHEAINLLECGGKRRATPLFLSSRASRISWRARGSYRRGKSAVVAALAAAVQKTATKRYPEGDF
ncbi:MAG: hypothetical protein DME77_10770 [Verrucomicrobia bacterium]|nr:MAG: hypothetical protein DME77_10770 [Verrucomicrobiota bacterium]